MQIFFASRLDEHQLSLSGQEAKHAVQVLRHKVGDQLMCIDGKGTAFEATITQAGKQAVVLDILHTFTGWGEKPSSLQLAVSPLRLKDRFEWIMEKAVELGVNEITPIICDHTIKFFKYKHQRLEQIILSATKQAKRSFLPILQEAIPIQEYLSTQVDETSVKIIAHCQAKAALSTYQTEIQASPTMQIMIGPEGDFSEAEIQEAVAAGFQEVSLGENRLRTETAGVYVLSAIKYMQGY